MSGKRKDFIALNANREVYMLCASEAEADVIGRFVRAALRSGNSVELVPDDEANARHESFLRTLPELDEAFAAVDARAEGRR